MTVLGLDIGGANIKIADSQGYAQSLGFPLWKQPEQLSVALSNLIASAPPAESIAVTMTGELADCFETKSAGVNSILAAVEQAVSGQTISVYLCDGRLVSTEAARQEYLLAAASNWHVLASFIRRYLGGATGLLIDMGSTTCDIIPIGPPGPCALGQTDPERLVAGELVYTGVQRSPVCSMVAELPWRGETCPVAQELFASSQDAYLLLGLLPEEPGNHDTADGRPCTRAAAHARLARSICADTTMFSAADAQRAAETIRDAQLEKLVQAADKVCRRMPNQPATIVLSGQGEFLARLLVERLPWSCQLVSLRDELGAEISRAACAHALAVLAAERQET